MRDVRAMGAPLGKLVDAAALARFLAIAIAGVPGATVRILHADGRPIAGVGSGDGDGDRDRDGDHDRGVDPAAEARRAIRLDGRYIGMVEVTAAPDRADDLAGIVASAVELAAGEGQARRAVTSAAIDDLRELSLLSRLAEMLGGSVDAAAIASCTLSTVSRPLGPAAGLVLGPDDDSVLAAAGDPADLAALRTAVGPLLAGLRATGPATGSCADVGPADGGALGSTLVGVLRTARGHQGTIALARRAGARPFSPADRNLVAAVASQAAVANERAGLQRQIADRQVLDHELAIGRRIQLSLMPRRFPALAGWQIASAYEPAREVGGDFYDAFTIRDRPDRIGLVVADVTGKGIAAAILMADARGLIHAAADHGGEPADPLARVNEILVSERASGLFVTVAHAVLEGSSGRLRLASAGHDPVHVLRADATLEVLDPPGRLVGMVRDIAARDVEVVLAPGDAWIGHTDGVTEARDAAGSFYGEERFRDLLQSLAGRSATEIVQAVVTDVASFRGVAEPSDDLTLLVVRRADPGERDADRPSES
jgi:serine phosphatase RsbU (regulator of sigma subunit)